jgi:drug/metabolite transporter (DMT)-like permease
MQKKRPIIYSAIILAMIFWAFSFVWIKVVYLAYGPLSTIFFRLIIASLIMLLITKLSGTLIKPRKKDIGNILLLAFFEPFLYFMGESFGLLYVSSTVGAVIIATIPLFSPIAASRFHGEKLSVRNLLGIIISFIGVAIVVFDSTLGIQASPIGITLVFIAVFAAIGYAIVLKGLTKKYNTTTIIAYQNFIGIFYFLPFWLGFEMNEFISTPFHKDAFMGIIKLAIFASCFSFILFTYGVKNIGVNNSNMFVNIIPVFTAIFAWFVIDEPLSTQKFTGIAVVISGLFFAQLNSGKIVKRLSKNGKRQNK